VVAVASVEEDSAPIPGCGRPPFSGGQRQKKVGGEFGVEDNVATVS